MVKDRGDLRLAGVPVDRNRAAAEILGCEKGSHEVDRVRELDSHAIARPDVIPAELVQERIGSRDQIFSRDRHSGGAFDQGGRGGRRGCERAKTPGQAGPAAGWVLTEHIG